MNVLSPPAGVIIKLGSIARHVEEALAAGGHPLDLAAVNGLLADPEVKAWLAAADEIALLPVKR
jgi:hypothetical protein